MGGEIGDPMTVGYAGGGWEDDRTRLAVRALEADPTVSTVSLWTTTTEAVDQLQSSAVDCVVCAYDSLSVDGPAVLDAVDRDIPLVAVFDADDGSRSAAALARGAARTLCRPPEATHWPDALVTTVRNAVEQRRLVEHSADAEKRYRSLFENNPHIIWEEDYSESKRRLDDIAARVDDLEAHLRDNPDVVRELMAGVEVIDVNENALSYYDAPSKAVLLDNLDQIFTDAAYDSATEMWLAIAAGETTFRWETVGLTLSGERKHEIIELSVPDEYADDLSRVYVTAMDITDRKRQERELQRQRDRLDEFASVVSHDLRNPLTVAEGHLELASAECDSDHLPSVADAHDRMRTLIDDLLSLAQDGRLVDDPDRVALPSLLDTCWEGVDTGAASLVVDTDQHVCADESRLKQLFENLFRNAVEHGGESATVTVGELEGSDQRGFFVADDGPGIPQADRDAVTEAGYTTSEDGTGFGLAIVRQVVDAHDWELAITESDQGGARFEFRDVDVISE